MKSRLFDIVLTVTALSSGAAGAEDYGSRLGVARGGDVNFQPRGSGVMFGALDPTVRRWHVPQELYHEYQWRQWEYSNYARVGYERYVDTRIAGDYFYDNFGDFISYGWLIYDWRQDQPQSQGSSLYKDPRFTEWFNDLTVSGDARGQYAYAVTVGKEIRTTLTPMTFSKPRFNGVQVDFAADKYAATVLASRITDPGIIRTQTPSVASSHTSLIGGRATVQIGDFITLGSTLVGARNSNPALDMFDGNFIAGNLTAGQSRKPVTVVAVVLSDDSPEDGEGGAALFGHDLRIRTRDFETGEETVHTLAEVVRAGAEWPAVFGGFVKEGFLAADGVERIILNYDFNDAAYIGPDLTSIIAVEFDYILANDYRIDMWSNRQTGLNGEEDVPLPPLTSEVFEQQSPVLLPVERAEGNIKDISNVRVVRFEYGLPTANLVGGFTIEGKNLLGFDFYGEWDRNIRYSQYPNASRFAANRGHEISSGSADAALLSVSRQGYPYFAYGELYSVAEDYSTSAFVSDDEGEFQYDVPANALYEFVDDNDDQDRLPDWARAGASFVDPEIFPGWDENNDFISDFNQNDNTSVPNTIPDYEEPFLRHHVDRPEFLFGIDLNNNGYIDRFEDDNLPDYPYKADRKGYNVFGGSHLTPDARIFVGHLDEEMFSDDRRNRTTYAMFTYNSDFPSWGRLWVFDMLKRVEDTIPEDRRAPSPFRNAPIQPLVEDILPAPETWVNTAWLGLDYTAVPRLEINNKLKYRIYNQAADDPRDIDGRPLEDASVLFGLVNKAEYGLPLGRLSVTPRLKSELLLQDAFARADEPREHWMGLAALVFQFPVLRRSQFTAGLELAQFHDLVLDEEDVIRRAGLGEAVEVGETGDFRSATFAIQLSNRSQYQGFHLTTQLGFRVGRTSNELIERIEPGRFERDSEGFTETVSFITLYAGTE